jgi:hypothetical protein
MINDILRASESLRVELDAQAEQNGRVDAAKTKLLELMIAAGPACENTLRLEWGQVQRVTKTEWEYRDRGVTEQNKVVEVANKALAAAKNSLRGWRKRLRLPARPRSFLKP